MASTVPPLRAHHVAHVVCYVSIDVAPGARVVSRADAAAIEAQEIAGAASGQPLIESSRPRGVDQAVFPAGDPRAHVAPDDRRGRFVRGHPGQRRSGGNLATLDLDRRQQDPGVGVAELVLGDHTLERDVAFNRRRRGVGQVERSAGRRGEGLRFMKQRVGLVGARVRRRGARRRPTRRRERQIHHGDEGGCAKSPSGPVHGRDQAPVAGLIAAAGAGGPGGTTGATSGGVCGATGATGTAVAAAEDGAASEPI